MRNFLYFLLRHTNFLVFLLLEALCAVLIFTCNDFHRASYVTSANAVSGTISSITNSIGSYFGLKSANEELLEQNTRLMTQLQEQQDQLAALRAALTTVGADTIQGFIADSVALAFRASHGKALEFRSAHVINGTSTRSRNMLTIDAGSADGVARDMAVINAQGVVGLVASVSNHFALVLPIINTSSHLSVKIKNSNHRGQLVWDGFSPRMATMSDVPEHAQVEMGDSIVTSGSSSFFPEGLLVGTVAMLEPDRNGGFFNIGVELAVDFNAVYAVQLIDNNLAQEQLELENSLEDE